MEEETFLKVLWKRLLALWQELKALYTAPWVDAQREAERLKAAEMQLARQPVGNKMERFTQRARHVLGVAQEQAERLRHAEIGPEHVLLALIKEREGVASKALQALKIDFQQVNDLVVEKTQTQTAHPAAPLALADLTKRLLEAAVEEARRMGHQYIGTEHLLLGLVRQDNTTAVLILNRLNAAPMVVRQEVRRILKEGQPQSSLPSVEQPDTHTRLGPDRALVINAATLAAERLQHAQVGPEHILLGLMVIKEGLVAQVWAGFPYDLAQAEALVGRLSDAEKRKPDHTIEFSEGCNALMRQALAEARQLMDRVMGPEHILLALMRQPDTTALDVLRQLNIDPEEVYLATRQAITEHPAS